MIPPQWRRMPHSKAKRDWIDAASSIGCKHNTISSSYFRCTKTISSSPYSKAIIEELYIKTQLHIRDLNISMSNYSSEVISTLYAHWILNKFKSIDPHSALLRSLKQISNETVRKLLIWQTSSKLLLWQRLVNLCHDNVSWKICSGIC